MKNIIFSVLLMALSLLLGCNSKVAESDNAQENKADSTIILDSLKRKQLNIQTTFLQLQAVQKKIRTIGKVTVPPQNMKSFSIPLGGYLKNIFIQPGQKFKKGDLLATFEDVQYIDLQQNYLQTTLRLEQAKLELDRQQQLYLAEAVGNKFLQEAKMKYNELAIEQKAIAEKLTLIQIQPSQVSAKNINKTIAIRANFDGITNEVNAFPGKYCSPTDVVFTLIQPTSWQINLTLFEKDLAAIRVGQYFTASPINTTTPSYQGTISFISPEVDANGAVQVIGTMQKASVELLQGRMMNAEIITEQEKKWCLPQQAVIAAHNKNYVIIETSDNRFELRTIKVATKYEKWVAIEQPETWKNVAIVQEGAYKLFMAINTE